MNISKKTLITCLIIIIVSTFVPGCMDDSSSSEGLPDQEEVSTITIIDMAGRSVEVPDNVERVVAVGAGALRQIAYLQAMDKVVGVETNEKDDTDTIQAVYTLVNFDKMSNLPEVGPAHGGDPELIAGAQPQVIIFSGTSGDISDAENYQTKTGIPVVFIDVGDMAGEDRQTTYQCWQICGEVLGKTDRADELQEYTEQLIKDLASRTADIPEEDKPLAFPGALSHRGGHGILSTQYPFATLEFINARHALDEGGIDEEDIKTHAFSVGQENLFSWNPDVIFIDLSNLELVVGDVERNPSYKDLKAFKDNNVHGFLPVSAYHRNYGSVLINSYYMGSVLYPDEFADIDIDEKADEIYEMFLGEPAYNTVKENLGGGVRVLSF